LSEKKYKLSTGIAYVITTGEPVFIKSISGTVATVRRAIVGQNGLFYETEAFDTEELETPLKRDKRQIEQRAAAQEIIDQLEDKKFELPDNVRHALQTNGLKES
jgi:hypothetical protein